MLDVDIRGLEDTVLDLKRHLPDALLDVAIDLKERGVGYTRELMELQIYARPTPSYEQTRKLIESADGFVTKEDSGFSITLEARGGANNRLYGAFVELGTYDSRVEAETVLEQARGDTRLQARTFSRGEKGMAPRPSVLPALAQVERDLEVEVLEAVDRVARG
jgi:hypothetical protein